MGTRADFYIGRGKNAEWLGSIAWDGYPEGLVPKTAPLQWTDWPKGAGLLDASTEADFRSRLERFFQFRDDVTRPEQGWPWPWDDSSISDFGYCFDTGRVWFWGYSKHDEDNTKPCWVSLTDNEEQLDTETPEGWPDMSGRKNVQFGQRSGIIIVRG